MSNTSDALTKSMEEQKLMIAPETKADEVVPLNIDTAFYALTPESQQQVKELADSIDVLRTENDPDTSSRATAVGRTAASDSDKLGRCRKHCVLGYTAWFYKPARRWYVPEPPFLYG